jgi:hypothetical protein
MKDADLDLKIALNSSTIKTGLKMINLFKDMRKWNKTIV